MSQIQLNLARKETLYTGKRLPHGCDVTVFPVILPRWSLQSTIKGCIGLINVQSIIATFAMHIISEITGVRNSPPRILRTANVCQSIYRISDYTRLIVKDETPTRL